LATTATSTLSLHDALPIFNNAGTNPYFGPMVYLDVPRAEKTVQVNQLSVVLWTQLAWKAALAERGGAIVNMASIGGLGTEPGIEDRKSTRLNSSHGSISYA